MLLGDQFHRVVITRAITQGNGYPCCLVSEPRDGRSRAFHRLWPETVRFNIMTRLAREKKGG